MGAGHGASSIPTKARGSSSFGSIVLVLLASEQFASAVRCWTCLNIDAMHHRVLT